MHPLPSTLARDLARARSDGLIADSLITDRRPKSPGFSTARRAAWRVRATTVLVVRRVFVPGPASAGPSA